MSDKTNIQSYLGEPKSLGSWISESRTNTGNGHWLVVEDTPENEQASLEMLCYPRIGDTGELTDDEYEKLDKSIHECGFCSFLNLDQIEDILSNLEHQLQDYTPVQALKAINYYLEKDAFLSLT